MLILKLLKKVLLFDVLIATDYFLTTYSMSLSTYKQILEQCSLDFLKNTCSCGNFDPDSSHLAYVAYVQIL